MNSIYDTVISDQSILKAVATRRQSAIANEVGLVPIEQSRAKYSFMDIPNTGMRLGYKHYGNRKNEKVIILLHGAGMSSAVWDPVGLELSRAGFCVFALDLRGHGRSTHSKVYTCDSMVADVHGFIIEKDLYTRPVCVVGMGVGGVLALALASGSPKLVGAVGMIEMSIVEDVCRDNGSQPWLSRWLGQERKTFGSVHELAGWLHSPLSSLGPRLARYCVEHDTLGPITKDEYFEEWMERATGVNSRCMYVANELLREESTGGFHGGGYEQRMDADFEFQFDACRVFDMIKSLTMHVMFAFGEYSTMVSRQDVCALSSRCVAAASVTVEEIPGRSSMCVRDDPDTACDMIIEYLEDIAMDCFDVPGGDSWSRTPANLGLRPLPQYTTLEEAAKALGPRRIPTKEAIEDVLRKLRVEAGRDADADSDDEVQGVSGSRTALSHDPVDYFGFVG